MKRHKGGPEDDARENLVDRGMKEKFLYDLEEISYTCRCRFATNRIDWICMLREVMSWDRSKDDFLQ